MRKVSLSMLTSDMRLGRPVCYGRSILVREGTSHLDRYANKLAELGIHYLYVEDAACEGITVDDTVSDKVRFQCKTALATTMDKIRSGFTLDQVVISDMLESLLDEITSHLDTLASLSEIGNTDESTLYHCVNTTIYAVCLGLQLNYSRSRLLEMAEGVLMHDIGKTLLDKNMLFTPRKLTSDEFEIVKTHTILGYQLLEKSHSLSEPARYISLSHHERLDGSGYPNGLAGDEISEYSRITAIVDMYEALTSDRCYRRAIPPYHALEVLTQDAVSKLDLKLVTLFMQNVAVYPNGTTVFLSDGSFGIVSRQNSSMPFRPVVRIISIENGKQVPKQEVDLMKVLNLTIIDPGTAPRCYAPESPL